MYNRVSASPPLENLYVARHVDLLFERTLPSTAQLKKGAHKAAIGLVGGALLAATLVVAAPKAPSARARVVASVAQVAGIPLEAAPPMRRHEDLPPDEPAQSYALIPTGVGSVRDLRVALAKDEALELHFADFNLAHAVLRVLDHDERAYVSYRKDGQILWTKHTLVVHKGEFVLDDGARQVRARCGNRIAEIETEPTPLLTQLERPPFEFPGPPPEIPPGAPLPPPTLYLPPPPPPPPGTCCNFPIIPPIYIPPGGGPPPSFPPPPPIRVPEPPTLAILAGAGTAAFLLLRFRLRRGARRPPVVS